MTGAADYRTLWEAWNTEPVCVKCPHKLTEHNYDVDYPNGTESLPQSSTGPCEKCDCDKYSDEEP